MIFVSIIKKIAFSGRLLAIERGENTLLNEGFANPVKLKHSESIEQKITRVHVE